MAILLAGFPGTSLHADLLFWDGGNGNTAGTPPAGGDGTWDANTTSNWASNAAGSSYQTWDGPPAGTEADFLRVEADVTVSGTIDVEKVTMHNTRTNSVTDWSFTGGTLNGGSTGLTFEMVSDDPTDTNGNGFGDDTGSTTTIDSLITGTGGLTFRASNGYRNATRQDFVLTNTSNSFTGGIVIDANRGQGSGQVSLTVSDEDALGPTSNDITLQSTQGHSQLRLDYTGTFSHAINFNQSEGNFGSEYGLVVEGNNTIEIADGTLFGGTGTINLFGGGGNGTVRLTYASASPTQDWVLDDGATLEVTNGNQLGSGSITLFDGSQLTADGTFTLTNEVGTDRSSGSGNAISVTSGNTLTLTDFGNTGDRRNNRLFRKLGDGTLNLNDADGFDGDGLYSFAVEEGTLLINNTSNSATGQSRVLIGNGATLGGDGRISPGQEDGGTAEYQFITVESGGIVAPGNSIGTITIDLSRTENGATFESGALFAMELDTGFQSDIVAFTDTGALTDAGIDVVFNDNVINFTDLSGGSLDFGLYELYTFDSETTYSGLLEIGSGLEAYNSALVYNTDSIQLNLTAIPEPGAAGILGLLGLLALMRRRRRQR